MSWTNRKKPCQILAAACMTLAGYGVHAATPADSADQALIMQVKYLATAGDCIACHTAAGG